MFKVLLHLILGCAVMAPGVVWGQASIGSVSGEVAQNSQLTILGSGFGTKSPAAPIKYDNFQAGTSGQTLQPGTGQAWEVWSNVQPSSNPQAYYPKYSDQQPRFAGDKTLRQYFYNTPNGYVSNVSVILRNVNQKVYVSGWAWNNRSTDGATTGLRNVKIWWHCYNGWETPTTRWDVYPENGSGHFTSEGCTVGSYTANEWSTSMPDKMQWQRLEIWHNRGSSSESESLRAWVNGALEAQFTVPYAPGCSQNSIYLMSYADQNSSGNGQAWLDWHWGELYVDNTLARVELGNNASFSACTHREIQIPTAWSTSQITVTANVGSFSAGSTAYLFIIDAGGNASAGFPVTIGGTVEPTAPGQPGKPNLM